MDKITTQNNANGVDTVNTYDPTRLYRLLSTVTTDNGSGFTPVTFGGGGSSSSGGGGGIGPLGPNGGMTFTCSSSVQAYTVPAGINQLIVNAYGAQGNGGAGGLGGEVGGTLAVTSGTMTTMPT